MTMTLRRCDSLPTRLREPLAAIPEPSLNCPVKTPDSSTDPNFSDPPVRDEVIATWNSLHTDVKKIKNGVPTKHLPNGSNAPPRKEAVKDNNINTFSNNNRESQRKITYADRHATFSPQQNVDRCSSFPLDIGHRCPTDPRASSARRRTLLERLLSWRIPECECRGECKLCTHSAPNTRVEDMLCTCGASRAAFTDKHSQYAERGRSKSVGYEVAREVTQFRRCASAGATVGAETAAALRARAALTLARRYYPEGGWGWTITVVGTIIQILSHGLQLGGGTGAIACTAAVKYRVAPVYTYDLIRLLKKNLTNGESSTRGSAPP